MNPGCRIVSSVFGSYTYRQMFTRNASNGNFDAGRPIWERYRGAVGSAIGVTGAIIGAAVAYKKAHKQEWFVEPSAIIANLNKYGFAQDKTVSCLRAPPVTPEELMRYPNPLRDEMLGELVLVGSPDQRQQQMDEHMFNWSYLVDVVGPGKIVAPCKGNGFATVMDQARGLTCNDWNRILARTVGGQQYGGNTPIYHLLLCDLAEVINSHDQPYVSKDHYDWKWINHNQVVVTFIWDDEEQDYRQHLHDGYIVIEYKSDDEMRETIPVRIVYIGDKKFPIKADYNDPYTEHVIAKFHDDFARWRKITKFIY